MASWTEALPFFTKGELGCRHCGEVKIDIRLAALLPAMRQRWGKPLTPTSVCRCLLHNTSVGGHPRSLHLIDNPVWPTDGSGAVDISWRDWPAQTKLDFARMAHRLGFRIGLHDSFVHLDIGRELGMSPAPFLYGSWSAPFNSEDIL